MTIRTRLTVALLAALLLPFVHLLSAARANHILLPDFTVQVGPVGSPMSVTPAMLESNSDTVVENLDGSFSFLNGSMSTANWEWNWSNLTIKPDPFISSAFGFQNISLSTMSFVISVSMPVAPLGPSTLIGGSMGGSVTDSSFDGLGGVSTVGAAAIYTGTIDGVGVVPIAELHPAPYSTAPFAFAGDTVSITPVSFGLPGPSAPGPPALLSIGITNVFSLSAGDSVSMTNFFIVEPVPEPSTMALASLGILTLTWFAARRRRA